jgi:hypothetical protein
MFTAKESTPDHYSPPWLQSLHGVHCEKLAKAVASGTRIMHTSAVDNLDDLVQDDECGLPSSALVHSLLYSFELTWRLANSTNASTALE